MTEARDPAGWINESLDHHPIDHPASRFLGKEFLLWLWWTTDEQLSVVELPHFGQVDLWVDDRIQFRTEGDDPQVADLKGGQPAATREARMALQGGKIVETARLGMRIKEREYALQIQGETLELTGVKVPGEVDDGVDERILERMFLLEEVHAVLDALFFRFCEDRLGPHWNEAILGRIRAWVARNA